MNKQKIHNGQHNTEGEDQVEGQTVPDYSKALLTKTLWYWHKDKSIEGREQTAWKQNPINTVN